MLGARPQAAHNLVLNPMDFTFYLEIKMSTQGVTAWQFYIQKYLNKICENIGRLPTGSNKRPK